MEECYAVLATEDREGDGAPVNSEQGKSAMSLTLSSTAPTGWSTRFMRWWRSCGHDLVDGGAVVSTCGRGGARGGTCSSERVAREEEGRGNGKTD
jgi:hypothetical protein